MFSPWIFTFGPLFVVHLIEAVFLCYRQRLHFLGLNIFQGESSFFSFWCNFSEAKIHFTAENACLFLQLKVKIIEYKTFILNYLQKMQQTFKEIAKATRQLTSAHLIKFSAISVNSLDLDSSFSE